MNIVIVGLGKVGFNLAKTFIASGHKVRLIEERPEVCEKVANLLNRPVICGDGSKPMFLRNADTGDADVFLAVTGKDEINMIACQIAKNEFKVKKAVARVNNPLNMGVAEGLGIDLPVSTTGYIADLIEHQLDDADTRFISNIMGGRICVKEIVVQPGSPLENRYIRDMNLPQNCILFSILRGGKMIVPRGNVMLQGDDIVVAAAPREHKAELYRAMKKLVEETAE